MGDRRQTGGGGSNDWDRHKALERSKTTLTRETSFYEEGSETDGSYDSSYHGGDGHARERTETEYTGSETEYTDDDYTDDYTDDYDSQRDSHTGSEYDSEDYYSSDDDRRSASSRRSEPSNYNSKSRDKPGFLPQIGGRSRTEPYVPGAASQRNRKNVTIFRNGDVNFPGRQVTLGPMFRSYEAFLDDVTIRIRSPFGAVRRLYKLPGGKLVRGLDDIDDGDHLVASRVEAFQNLKYAAIMDYTTRQRTYVRPDLERIKYKQRAVKGRNRVEHALTLYCLGNGDKDGILTQVVLKPRDRSSFEHVLDLITEKLGYQKLPSAAKKLIDLETRQHVTSLDNIQNNHIYVAIDRPDHVVMPNFRVDPETRELIPLVRRTGPRVKNMPIMFEDDVIRGKIYSGKKVLDRRRERTGLDSDVGKVTLGKRGIRRPKELPPIKQPFQVNHHAHDNVAFRRANVKNTPEDRATWRIVNALIDEETSSTVEEVLQELEHDLLSLLERFVSVKGGKRGGAGAGPPPAGAGARSRRGGDPGGASTASGGPQRSMRSSRRSRRDVSGRKGSAGSTRKPAGGKLTSARPPADRSPASPSPSPSPVPPPTPPPTGPVHDYDADVDRFLEYMAYPTSDIFRKADTPDEAELRDKLIGAMDAAMAGRLAHWEHNPKSAVALVILLDQIPRRVYQGRAQMYSGDTLCQEVIFRLVRTNQKLLQEIKPTTLLFVCIALSHHEDREAQAMAHHLWKDIKGSFSRDDAEHAAQSMQQNREIIEEFGRFPQRNRILSRANNSHEQKYLDKLEARTSSTPADQKSGAKTNRKSSRRQGSRSLFGRSSKR
eukprot:m.451977 g.451977  ORF g.451977 m.451977 type:complete len:827 (+) comp20246_c0_seq1:153-2633(+)